MNIAEKVVVGELWRLAQRLADIVKANRHSLVTGKEIADKILIRDDLFGSPYMRTMKNVERLLGKR